MGGRRVITIIIITTQCFIKVLVAACSGVIAFHRPRAMFKQGRKFRATFLAVIMAKTVGQKVEIFSITKQTGE